MSRVILMTLTPATTILLVVLVLVILVVAYVISLQRRLVSLDEVLSNALSQIQVQENSRWDALVTLAKAATGFAEHERETLEGIIAQRKSVSVSENVSDLEKSRDSAQSALGRLFAVAEAYPDLKSAPIYQNMMDSINNYENKVRLQRMVYNDAATQMNRMVRMFPGNLIAGALGFGTKTYFQAEAGKTQMPELNLRPGHQE